MIAFESRQVRRLVGRLERGESLLEGLAQIAAKHGIVSASVRGLGAVEWVELCEYDQSERAYREPIRVAHAEVLNLTGNLSLRDGEVFAHLHGSFSREVGPDDDRRIEVVGGHISAAQVFACEFVLDCYDDIMLARKYDSKTGLDLWFDPLAEHKEDQASTATQLESDDAVSWSQVAAASDAVQDPRVASQPPEVAKKRRVQMPKPGDEVDHKTFGRCRIVGRGTDGALILKPQSGGRHRKVRIDHFEILGPTKENGRRVFVLRPR